MLKRDDCSVEKWANEQQIVKSGVNILQKEEDFVLGIFRLLQGRIPQNLKILRKTINQGTHFGVLGRISYCFDLKNYNLQ